jgi:hypothetical protein
MKISSSNNINEEKKVKGISVYCEKNRVNEDVVFRSLCVMHRFFAARSSSHGSGLFFSASFKEKILPLFNNVLL